MSSGAFAPLHVLLLWRPRQDAVTVSVDDTRGGHRFDLAVARDPRWRPSITHSPTPPSPADSTHHSRPHPQQKRDRDVTP